MKICKIDDCTAPAITRGWCKKHYTRWIENGSTERAWACQTCGAALDHSAKRYCGPDQKKSARLDYVPEVVSA